jgi:hypothetical protein
MKTLFVSVLVIAFLLTAGSCKKDDVPSICNLISISYYETGGDISKFALDSKGNYVPDPNQYVTTFDAVGNITYIEDTISLWDGSKRPPVNFYYDQTNRLINWTSPATPDFSQEARENRYYYNASGQLEKVQWFGGGELAYEEILEYRNSTDKNPRKRSLYDFYGVLLQISLYTFDTNKKFQTGSFWYWKSGYAGAGVIGQFVDGENNPIGIIITNYIDNTTFDEVYNYTYNSSGYPTSYAYSINPCSGTWVACHNQARFMKYFCQ